MLRDQDLEATTKPKPPVRALRLTLMLEADTRRGLADALRNMAWRVDAENISTGVSGGPDSGSIYELLHDPSQTHDTYHAQLRLYLAERAAAKDLND